jgi:hypothetical protein
LVNFFCLTLSAFDSIFNGLHGTVFEKLIITLSSSSSSIMEPKGSLPCLQEPTTGSYLEPDESVHSVTPCFSRVHFHTALSTPRSPRCFLPNIFLTQILYAFHINHNCVACAILLIFYLIIRIILEEYKL